MMKVYLVWDGYEDIDSVYLKRESADKRVEKLRRDNPFRASWGYSVSEEEVIEE